VGINERRWSQIAGFRDDVDVCGLCDLGFKGVSWTFEKKVAGGSFGRVRLDRALASASWCSRFPAAEVQHLLSYATSDHLPILLRYDPPRQQRRGDRLFRYEVMWETHDDFSAKLANSWSSTGISQNM
jgi:hypothetical protein